MIVLIRILMVLMALVIGPIIFALIHLIIGVAMFVVLLGGCCLILMGAFDDEVSTDKSAAPKIEGKPK